MKYQDFLRSKIIADEPTGHDPGELSPSLYPFQRDITAWALRRGRAAIFADCGMGKTLIQLEWARDVCRKTGGNVLILAPLAVTHQTVAEGARFGIEAHYCRKQGDAKPGITVTNYEMLERFDPAWFSGVVLDESSILKSYSGKIRNQIISTFQGTPYRLACTATPAPNDYMELGNHCEFLGVMSRVEMLSMFFTHDGGNTSQWRLKGHGESEFWKWVCTWAVMIRKPSDLGYEDNGFILPGLNMVDHVMDMNAPLPGMLFETEAQTLQERQAARRNSIEERAEIAASLARGGSDQ